MRTSDQRPRLVIRARTMPISEIVLGKLPELSQQYDDMELDMRKGEAHLLVFMKFPK